jgi:hypothetical protein
MTYFNWASLFRWIATIALLNEVYPEVGPWTFLILVLFALHSELTSFTQLGILEKLK